MVLYRAWDSGRDVLVGWNDSVLLKYSAFAWRLAAVFVLLFGIFVTMPGEVAKAQSTGGGGPSIGELIGEIAGKKFAELGFTDAEQSVIAATYSAMSDTASGLAGGSWLSGAAKWSLAAGLMLTPTPLGDDSLTAWQMNHDGTVTASSSGSSSGGSGSGSGASPYAPLSPGQPYWCWGKYAGVGYLCGGSIDAAAQAFIQGAIVPTGTTNTWAVSSCSATTGECNFNITTAGGAAETDTEVFAKGTSWSGGSCASGLAGTSGCMTYVPSTTAPIAPVTESVGDAIATLPASDLATPLSADVFADLINGLWEQAASQAGYQGVPYPADDPVTAGDVQSVETSTTGWPTVGTATSPVSAPSDGSNPYAIPAPSSAPTGGTGSSNPASSPSGTSGSDTSELCAEFPSIIACQDPGSATAPDLPTSSASVSVSPVTVGASDGVCPQPVSVSVLGMDLSFSYQSECDFMTRVRPFVLAMSGIIAAVIFGMGLKS
ncbi:MAG TPA: virulence factor TspB C-terminal domain-related protein [Paraburkholderia sp.]|jgi:hypothetical protein|nr:virulence factor TspB C-terminal domain-related protein [Paraburkholderia sp.]